ncbi:MAG: aspartate-alanine antiporter [Bacteroidetes bacterium]|nr:MAG: aspartate-alanine antiporter [Bacteroidota bacterium]
MNWFLTTFREHPELAVFLTIAAGFFIGRFKYKTFSLGNVTSVLLVGVIVGQMRIDISGDVKQIFFLIFLFSVGYTVGPQFFNSLRKSGLPQLLFTTIIAAVALVATWLLAKMMGYNVGQAAGLFAGAQTISAVIGVGGDTINSLNIDPALKKSMVNAIPVCYAVTYLFGTIGSAFFLAQVGPLFWGGLKKARQQCIDLAAKLGVGSDDPSLISSYHSIVFRAFNISSDSIFVGKTVDEMQKGFIADGYRLYVEKVRRHGTHEVLNAAPDFRFEAHDDVVLQGKGVGVITEEKKIGKEIFDPQLLKFEVESVSVLLTAKTADGMTIQELSHERYDLRVSLQKITRGGTEIPMMPQTILQKGDMLYLMGPKKDVQAAVKLLGIPDISTNTTDLISVGLGILLGGLVGALAFHAGKVTLSLSTSGGALIAGLFFGWLRSRHPNVAQIPQPALWIMTNLGLNAFIAVVGISAGPSFVDGFKQVGPMLFVIGAAASLIPLFVGILMARYVFKFNVALGLGCCSGARTTTAALPAVQDSLESPLPALGYTVTYAVGNTLLIICGIIIVFLIN